MPTPVIPDPQQGHSIIDANNAPTYACSYVGLVPAAATTDLAILNGAVGKVIRVMRVAVSLLTTSGTAATLDLVLAVRSTADTGGTLVTNVVPTPFDQNDPAALGVLAAYSANPASLGTLVGNIYVVKQPQVLGTPTVTDFPTNVPLVVQWGITDSKPIVLRGAGQGLALNFAGQTFAAGASVDITFEWTELNS